jgi:hypothetical protein
VKYLTLVTLLLMAEAGATTARLSDFEKEEKEE